MDNRTEEQVKNIIRLEMITFKILEKGLREQMRVGDRHNKRQAKRVSILRRKYKETTNRYKYSFTHEDGNEYGFDNRYYQPTGKLSSDLRHLYLARAFTLGVPYKVVENNSKTTNTINRIKVEEFVDRLIQRKYSGYWFGGIKPETIWDYLTSRFDETNKVKAIEKWLTAT